MRTERLPGRAVCCGGCSGNAMELGIVISQQLRQFLCSILLGGVLALLYDLARPLRTLGGRMWSGVLDALLSIAAVSSVFFFVMSEDGELRLFMLLGTLGGAVLFFCLLSRALQPIWNFWFAVFTAPLRFLWKILKKIRKLCKKLFSFSTTWFTITYTKLRGKCAPQQEGEEAMAAAKKTEKKRPSSRLTAIILVVLLLGVGIQLYNMFGQLQAARAEQEVYAQRLADLLETNERLESDIARSDDPAFIENVARNQLGMVKPNEKIFHFGK